MPARAVTSLSGTVRYQGMKLRSQGQARYVFWVIPSQGTPMTLWRSNERLPVVEATFTRYRRQIRGRRVVLVDMKDRKVLKDSKPA